MFEGGSWFAFDLAKAQLSVLVVAHLYNEYCEDDETKLDPTTVWSVAGGLSALWLVSFGHFVLRVAVPDFRHTLWSTQTAWQTSCAYFLENEDDKKRVVVFHQNRVLWEGRIGGEVKAWVAESWDRWERDDAAWLKKVTPTIPDEYLPAAAAARLGGARERRGSAAGSVRLSLRLSAREREEE
jgi:hypothetical protein